MRGLLHHLRANQWCCCHRPVPHKPLPRRRQPLRLFRFKENIPCPTPLTAFLAHDYEDVAAKMVWDTVQLALSPLRGVVVQEIERLFSAPDEAGSGA